MSDPVNILPEDEHNKKLVDNTHPADWENPEPDGRYNLAVIGAGTAGLVAAAGSAGLGAKVALIERHLFGGDCLNFGCVPSKALIRSSRAMRAAAVPDAFGIKSKGAETDFAAIMERLRKLRAGISEHDSAARFASLGIDVFIGEAVFSGPDTITVGDKTIRFKKAVIASGARAYEPDIPGLADAGFLTNETVFSLTELPKRLAVVGAGPIGCELAQAFQRLGSEVTLLSKYGHILPREDEDAAEIVQKTLFEEGMSIVFDMKIEKVELDGRDKVLSIRNQDGLGEVRADAILIGVGRVPNVEGMGLENAGVTFDKRKGINVNDKLQTGNKHIYAAGDCAMQYKFTHAADFAARIVIQNALFMGRKKLSALTIPWSTYTSPEIAHVGLYPREAEAQGIAIDTYTKTFDEVDRAILDGETEGFVKIHTRKGKGEILGATIVAHSAGDLISEISVAMAAKLSLGSLANVIHPYPTQAEAIRQAGDLYNRTRLTPFIKKLFSKWLAWTR